MNDLVAKMGALGAASAGSIAGRGPGDAKPTAGELFEQLLARTLLKEVQKATEGGLFGEAAGPFGDLMLDELAARIAESGQLGLAAQIDGGQVELRSAPVPTRRDVFPVDGAVSSSFGVRTDPFTGEHRAHEGIDIAAPAGSAIRAVRGGTVTFAGERGGYGNAILLDHGDGTVTLYGHCRDLAVVPGQRVGAGARIGTVGSTGRATGPHLHLEVRRDGHAIDPKGVFEW